MATSRKGNFKKSSQKHQNHTVYKINQKFTDITHLISTSDVTGVCKRCRDIICWKLKYNKYKPLSVPRKCTCCLDKSIGRAYYTLCKLCSEKKGVCAKCQDITPINELIGTFPQVRHVVYL